MKAPVTATKKQTTTPEHEAWPWLPHYEGGALSANVMVDISSPSSGHSSSRGWSGSKGSHWDETGMGSKSWSPLPSHTKRCTRNRNQEGSNRTQKPNSKTEPKPNSTQGGTPTQNRTVFTLRVFDQRATRNQGEPAAPSLAGMQPGYKNREGSNQNGSSKEGNRNRTQLRTDVELKGKREGHKPENQGDTQLFFTYKQRQQR